MKKIIKRIVIWALDYDPENEAREFNNSIFGEVKIERSMLLSRWNHAYMPLARKVDAIADWLGYEFDIKEQEPTVVIVKKKKRK